MSLRDHSPLSTGTIVVVGATGVDVVVVVPTTVGPVVVVVERDGSVDDVTTGVVSTGRSVADVGTGNVEATG